MTVKKPSKVERLKIA